MGDASVDYAMLSKLNPEKALIWRIVHRDNLWWILDNGLHCGNDGVQAPDWVSIGNSELIGKRANHPVPLPPGGFLNDYVPFYFTPFSPMLYNIRTGRGGIQKRPNEEKQLQTRNLNLEPIPVYIRTKWYF